VPIDSVSVRGLSKRYGQHRALIGVDLDLAAGRVCALLGPNGAGKSTLLGVVSTLVRPSGGEVEYRDGTVVRPHDDGLRREIGVLAHASLVYGELDAEENLRFWADMYDVPDGAARATALLDEVGLEPSARRRPARTYSRGMTQRLSLARALLPRPRLLLLDEPFTGLDRTGALSLARSIEAAKRDGCMVLVITHDLEAIAGVTDHVAVIRRGKIVHEVRADAASGAGFSYEQLKAIYTEHGG
jgi:heme exporter protein A